MIKVVYHLCSEVPHQNFDQYADPLPISLLLNYFLSSKSKCFFTIGVDGASPLKPKTPLFNIFGKKDRKVEKTPKEKAEKHSKEKHSKFSNIFHTKKHAARDKTPYLDTLSSSVEIHPSNDVEIPGKQKGELLNSQAVHSEVIMPATEQQNEQEPEYETVDGNFYDIDERGMFE